MDTPEHSADYAVSPCPRCHARHGATEPCASLPSAEHGPLAPVQRREGEPRESADPYIGTVVGNYRLQRKLGSGGMGAVYLAEHAIIGSRVAIKVLNPRFASDADLVRRFYDEARAVNLIGHENIVSIYDLSAIPPDRYYIVMEYLEGRMLSSRMGEERVKHADALHILIQLCDALHAAHRKGIVHRDLKPDNVFLVRRSGRDDFVKLLDFGIAKLRDRPSEPAVTAPGLIVGTPEYMAPEQFDGRSVDARSDIYALGVVAYHLATGRLPFTQRDLTALAVAHLAAAPEPPSQLDPTVPREFEEAILRALVKQPEGRFADMGAFGEALTRALECSGATPPPVPRVANATAALATPHPVYTRRAAGFDVDVRFPGQSQSQRLRAVDISRGGVFLCSDGAPPALFSRVRIVFQRPGSAPPLELAGETVRHVTAAEAQAWKMAPGFGVQFVDLTPEMRQALGTSIDGLPAAPAPSAERAPADDPTAAPQLAFFRKRVSANHYEFLGLPPDADLAEVRSRARRLRAEVEVLRAKRLSSGQADQVRSVLERIDAAIETLATPERRIDYDAQRGNYLGVARCIKAGVPIAEIEARHRAFLAVRPDAEATARGFIDQARTALATRNEVEALQAYEAALAVTPLDLALHQRYWALKRKRVQHDPAG